MDQQRDIEQLLEDYEIVPSEETKLFDKAGATDPAKRREMKIAQAKKTKELRSKISVR